MTAAERQAVVARSNQMLADIATLRSSAPLIDAPRGHILGPHMMLKPDQFPTLHNAHLQDGPHAQPRIDGAPNFRQIGKDPIYGVAQPTIDGIKRVLEQVGAGPGGAKTAYWTNLREEPVIYVNGKPYNPRKRDQPYDNVEQPDASAEDVERSDARLKQDVLDEAKRNGGYLVFEDEETGPDGKPHLVERREKVETVQTPREVYDELKAQGYRVDYARVPVSDEKVPSEQDLDALVQRFKNADPDAPEIFNCHAGRGRTTTGEVIADIMRRARLGKDDTSIVRNPAVHEDIREQGDYHRGNYRSILRLIQSMDHGGLAKSDADHSIDRSDAMTNLREAIAAQQKKAREARTPEERAQLQARAQDYLKRYFYLVAFDEYAREQAPDFNKPFSQWMDENGLRDQLGELELAQARAMEGSTACA
jgi:hypothetical protein